jgi:hypothetical protein
VLLRLSGRGLPTVAHVAAPPADPHFLWMHLAGALPDASNLPNCAGLTSWSGPVGVCAPPGLHDVHARMDPFKGRDGVSEHQRGCRRAWSPPGAEFWISVQRWRARYALEHDVRAVARWVMTHHVLLIVNLIIIY